MPRVIATHPVGNMDKWLAGGERRATIFKKFSSGYTIYRQPDQNRIAILWENADMARLQAAMNDPETIRAKDQDTVMEPVEVYVEIEGGR